MMMLIQSQEFHIRDKNDFDSKIKDNERKTIKSPQKSHQTHWLAINQIYTGKNAHKNIYNLAFASFGFERSQYIYLFN